jgi:hypothetical protein
MEGAASGNMTVQQVRVRTITAACIAGGSDRSGYAPQSSWDFVRKRRLPWPAYTNRPSCAGPSVTHGIVCSDEVKFIDIMRANSLVLGANFLTLTQPNSLLLLG